MNEFVSPDFNMQDILSEMAGGLPGVRMVTVIDIDSMVLASWQSPDNSLSPEGLGVFMQRINSTINAFKQSADGFTRLGNIILNTPAGHIILKPICNGACFIAVDAPNTMSLGLIRTVYTHYAPRLEQAVPGYSSMPPRDETRAIIPHSQALPKP